MTLASYWLTVCGTRCTAGFPSLVSDPWCKRLLNEAAGSATVQPHDPDYAYRPQPLGRDGYVWTFADGSKLLATSDAAVVR